MDNITTTSVDKTTYQEYIKDLEFLYRQFNQFYIDNNYNIYLDKKETSEIDFIKMINEDFSNENALCFLAYKDKNPVGYILGYSEHLSECFITDLVSYIDTIYIDESTRGLGLGKLLIKMFSENMSKKYNTKIVRLNVKSIISQRVT